MIWVLLILLLLLILSLPWGLRFERWAGRNRLYILAAAVPILVPLGIGSDRKRRDNSPEPSQSEGTWLNNLNMFFEWVAIAREVEWRELFTAIHLGLRGIRVRVRKLNITFASPDPALTGILYGFSHAAAGMTRGISAGIYADFTLDRPRADFKIDVTLIPLALPLFAIRVVRALPLRRVITQFRNIRKAEAEGASI